MDAPTRPIMINCGTQSFEFDLPDALWFDMLAFCKVTGLTLEELINHALEEFLPQVINRP